MNTLLSSRISLRFLIWMFPVAFLIHDLEEVLTIERFIKANIPNYQVLRFYSTLSTQEFFVAVLFLLALIIFSCFLAARVIKPGLPINLFFTGVAVLLDNSITHPIQAIIVGAYVPGLMTAMLIALPYSIFCLLRLKSEGLVSKKGSVIMIGLGFILQVPLSGLALVVGKLII